MATGDITQIITNTTLSASIDAAILNDTTKNFLTDAERGSIDIGTALSTTATTLPTAVNEVVTRATANEATLAFVQSDLDVITSSLASLSSAQASIDYDGSVLLPLDGTAIDMAGFNIVSDSSDTSVMELDGTTGKFIFKRAGRYSWTTNLYIGTIKDSDKQLRISMLDQEGHLVLEQTLGTFKYRKEGNIIPVSTLLVISQAEIDLHPTGVEVIVSLNTVEVETDTDLQLELTGFSSVLASMSDVYSGFADHNQLTGVADTDSHPSTAISVVPNGNLTSTEVQSALNELQGKIDSLTVVQEW